MSRARLYGKLEQDPGSKVAYDVSENPAQEA